jgi:hypothetical protein
VDDHLHAVLGPHVGDRQLLSEEHRPDLALGVLQVKKQWPDGGNEGWLTSPSTQTSAGADRRRAAAARGG